MKELDSEMEKAHEKDIR